jgi:S-adenosylmethionine:tRNA ribosyltransferase-isomerase
MIDFDLPDTLSADRPPEERGLARDDVRLLVTRRRGVEHARFHQLTRFLRRGDLVVVNTSATLAAAVDAVLLRASGRPEPVVVHLATERDDGSWVLELRSAPAGAAPVLDAHPGESVRLAGGRVLRLTGPAVPQHRTNRLLRPDPAPIEPLILRPGTGGGAGGVRLWRAAGASSADLHRLMRERGRPIRYGYVDTQWPLAAYQTVFGHDPGSAEMPSAGRPFSEALVTRLVSAGVLVAPLTLHTGVSSLEAHEPPPAERFTVPAATAALVNHTRARGGRVVAVGTTVTRALESVADPDGIVHAGAGWTDLVLSPERPARAVTGLVTGLHAPGASHLLLLEAVAGADLVRRSYTAAVAEGYLWHEFGDSCLLLP